MKKYIMIVAALFLTSSLAYAQQTIKLSPHQSKSLTNSLLWTLKASCNIQGGKNGNKIQVSVLEKSGSVNGKNLSKGHAASVKVKNNETLSVSAESGATVNIVNLGSDTLLATCV